MLAVLLISITAGGRPAHGDDGPLCGAIASDTERLACYDRLYRPARPTQAPASTTAAPAVDASAGAAEPEVSTPETHQTPTPVATSPPPTAPSLGEEDIERAEPAEEPPAPTTVAARIERIEVMSFGKRRFILDNGQAWQQNEADRKRFAVGVAVTIERAGLSGYRLIAENGVSTRVSRIR